MSCRATMSSPRANVIAVLLLVGAIALLLPKTEAGGGFVADEEQRLNLLRPHRSGPLRHRVARDVTGLIRGVRWSPVGGRSARSPLPAPKTVTKAAAPLTLPALTKRAHNVGSGPIVLKSKKKIFIPKFTYDGAGPDVYFLVGKGAKVTHKGATKIPTPTGETKIKKGYTGQDVTLTLPGSLTFNDVDWFAVYCITYEENFGDVRIPKNLNLPAI
ncbi:protein Skeletor, isoforms B/C-like [Dermacentor andersoni]|uniref:protein Skeletor, isoforms B/C-like n=1 Tax=Dermacentor andersoni TaxID=34620 RepID=UPI002155A44A|nr:protein Skeletor, isoforms B/C-like [Dermacentor andersoni]